MEKKRKLSIMKAEEITRAIKAGSLEEFKHLVSKEFDFNAILSQDQGSLPIHLAAELGRFDIIEFLIANNVNVDTTDKDGLTPLFYAVKTGQLFVINRLIFEMKSNLKVVSKEGSSLLHFACNRGNPYVVAFLLNALEKFPVSERNMNIVDESGETPLYAACNNGYEAVVGTLLNFLDKIPEIKRYLNKTDERGNTPLHFACKRGDEAVVRLLLNALEKIPETERNLNKADKGGNTPLHTACYYKYRVIISLLLSALEKIPWTERNLNVVNGVGETPLHVACNSGDKAVVRFLLKALEKIPGFERNLNKADIRGKTPLHFASKCKDVAVIGLLLNALERIPESVHNLGKADEEGKTPLHIACENGTEAVVGLLLNALEKNSEIERNLNKADKMGRTPLHYACFHRHNAVVGLLLNALKKIPEAERNLNIADNWGSTPLHIACGMGNEAVVASLLNAGARSDNRNYDGLTEVYFYLLSREFNLRQLDFVTLEKMSSNTDLNNRKMSLAHWVSLDGDLDSLKIVICLQKNLNSVDIEGDTPLNYLTKKLVNDVEDKCNEIKLLINNGAFFTIKDSVRVVDNYFARNVLFTDSSLCARSSLNRLDYEAMSTLYDSKLSDRLPPREKLMSNFLWKLENFVTIEIRDKGYCDFEKLIYPLFYLSVLRLSSYCKSASSEF